MINIKCPKCSKKYALPDESIGKKWKCTCWETFEVRQEPDTDNIDSALNFIQPINPETNAKKDFFTWFWIVVLLVIAFAFIGWIINRLTGVPVILFDVINIILILAFCFYKFKEKRYYFIIWMILSFLILRVAAHSMLSWQEWKLRDTQRQMNIKLMMDNAEIYYQTNSKYPELSEMSISDDPLEWKTIDWCEFWYKYEKISDEKYKVSTCFENLKEFLDKDWWNDDLRYETGNFKD